MVRIIQTADLVQGKKLSRNDKDWIYNGLDCCVTLEVFHEIQPMLDNTSQRTYEFSMTLQGPVMEMQTRGVLIDIERRNQVLGKYKAQIARVARNLSRIVKKGIGVDLNWRSPKQLGQLLYDVMGIPAVRKRNAHGFMARTTNRDALEKLTNYFMAEPICNHILTLRDLDKKRQFLETGIDKDNRIRCNFNIGGTNSGRLSSSMSDFSTGTNLQNIDPDLRSVFIPEPGMKFGNLDLEQADSRNLGAMCWNLFHKSHGEEFAGSYLDACESGDLHTTVCQMASPELEWTGDLTKDRKLADQVYYRNKTYRDKSKTLGHGTNFLGKPPTMAKHSKFPVSDIILFQSNYFKAFACIPEYHKWVAAQLKEFGCLETLLGRRRFFFGRHYDEKTIRDAVAYIPQSMTADEIDQGIINIFMNRLRAKFDIQLLIQVHDSILFQYPEHLEHEIIPWALAQLKLTIPLFADREYFVPVDAQVGWNWGYQTDDNPGGMIKYTGKDERTRPPLTKPKMLSVRDL